MSALSRALYKLTGLASLITTTILWGTSFAFIKLSMSEVDPFTYTFVRTAIATLTLTPILLYKYFNGSIDKSSFTRGFIVGLAYSIGLCLQAAGTAYVDPSLSAFITGISTIHVHFYAAFIAKKYSLLDLAALVLAIAGLYVLTAPAGGFGAGAALVFVATFAWAAQIVLIERYRGSSTLEFLTGTFSAGLVFAPLSLAHKPVLTSEAILYLVYLALVCSIGATFFQVLGQRRVSAETAALIFLLEPVFATIFSALIGLEAMSPHKILGGSLLLASLYIATISEIKYKSQN